jgi:uncharacterized protein (DUF433 family)
VYNNFSNECSIGVADSSCGKLLMEGVMPWIVSDTDHLAGKPRVQDTRIAVALLLEWLAAGMTIEEIVKEYPSLTEEAIRGTLEELAHSELLAPSENPSRREPA